MSVIALPRNRGLTQQPQHTSQLAGFVNPKNSCVYCPSLGAVDIATGRQFSTVGSRVVVASNRGLAEYTNPTNGACYRTLVAGDGIRGQAQYILFGVYELTPYDGTYVQHAVQMSGGYGDNVILGAHENYQTPTAVGCYVRPNNQVQSANSTFFAANSKKTVSAALFVKTGQLPVLVAAHEDGYYEEIALGAVVINAGAAFNMLSFSSNGYQSSVPTQGSRRLMLGGVLAQPDVSLGMARSIARAPWQVFALRRKTVFVPVSAGGGSASGSFSPVSVTPQTAGASGSALASGPLAAITISAPTATASAGGGATASGSFAALSISPATATATATKSATASGSFAVVSLSAPTATASGTTAGGANATGAPAQITISHATAIAIGSAVASGGYQSIGITAPSGSASSVAGTIGRPISDASNSGWTPSSGSDLYQMLDEVTPSDSDYISTSAIGSVCKLALNGTQFPGSASQQLILRAASATGNGLTVSIKDGVTTIATRYLTLTPTFDLHTITLTAGEIALISSGSLTVEMTST